MGCLTRLFSFLFLVVIAAGAWWWWNGGSMPLPAAVAERIPFGGKPSDSMSAKPSDMLARARWVSAASLSGDVDALDRLGEKGGPSRISLEAGDVASFISTALVGQLPSSAEAVSVALVDDMVYVKASVPIAELGAESILGPLAGALSGRDTVIIGGNVEFLSRGLGQVRIREVVVGDFSLPRPLVPRLVSLIRKGTPPEGIDNDAFPVRLPEYIGDLRVSRGQITAYGVE